MVVQEILCQWASINEWINRHQNGDNIGLDQIAHDAFAENLFSSGGVFLTIPHELLSFTSLKMRLVSGHYGFNSIIRGCEVRRWYRWGNSDVATNGGERSVDRHGERRVRINVEG